MPNAYRTSEEIVASRLEDGRQSRLFLKDMNLFASGAFSNVYRGVARTESNHSTEVVIKKTWPRNKGSPIEVKILGKLNRLKHKNIVRLLYSYQKEHTGRICLAMIFEYVPLNLHQYLKQCGRRIDVVEVKLITWQLFRGQSHLQKMEICHRDIKPQNLLYDADTGLLKISDFGSSSFQTPKIPQPSYHVTRYYRPPELLLGAKIYGCAIDTWSCGCVFAELLKGGVFLAGKNTNNQAELIFDLLGLPSAEDLSAMKVSYSKYQDLVQIYDKHGANAGASLLGKLLRCGVVFQGYEPDASKKTSDFSYLYNQTPSQQLERRTAVFNTDLSRKEMQESVELLKQVLTYNPQKRLSGTDFLIQPYFRQLFSETTVRSNGKKIGCLTSSDWNNVKDGDRTVTNESTDENTRG